MKANETGIDFFLDDGLHESRSQITSLIAIWPYIKTGGLYLIEDMHKDFFETNIKFIKSLSLNASVSCFELPAEGADNRILCLQKI